MDPTNCVAMLSANARRVAALVSEVGEDQARWKPNAETWSMLEVVNHLWEEEQRDFCVRLEHILFKPDKSLPPIDPTRWVVEHAYNERDMASSLNGYLDERRINLAWLATLHNVDWGKLHPYADWATAGNMLASWVAHDLLHMRQLVELHWAWTERQVAPYSTQYAGDW